MHTVNRDDSNQLTNIKISYHSGQPSLVTRKHAKQALLEAAGVEEDDDSVRSQGGGPHGEQTLTHTYVN